MCPAAPTGDGKSLVAEVIILRALAAEKIHGPGVARKAMLVSTRARHK